MKILYVNDNDLMGRRFNGHDLQLRLNKEKGFEAKQFVASKTSKSKNTVSMIKGNSGHFIREKCMDFHNRISMQSVVYPFGELIAKSKEFEEADIVHYHLIFNYFMSLSSFKKLVKMKPSVWTLHDPWALTGHCVHPVDCQGWLSGCKKCPYLDRYAPLQEDNASSIWNMKKEVYKDLDVDIVVASEWMYDIVKRSPLGSFFKRIHVVPFGVDLELFRRRKKRNYLREQMKIPKENFVIMFRQSVGEWKGVSYIKKMLSKLNVDKPVTILTVEETGMLNDLKDKYQIIEYEWVNDNNLMVDLYSVADLFLMPSVAEAFGLMAIEAMACSLPVIVFEGTSLPKVTFAPDCGIALKREDTGEFVKTVKRLIENPKESNRRGTLGRQLAEQHYEVERHHRQLMDLYKSIYDKNKK